MSESEQCAGFRDAGDAPGVNLVAGNLQVRRQMNGADSIGDFFSLKAGLDVEQSQPDRFRCLALDALGVHDAPPKHLVASADSDCPTTCATMPQNEVIPADA